MLHQDDRVLFYTSKLSNDGETVQGIRKDKNLRLRSIVPSDSSAVARGMNRITPNENCDQKFTRLVKV